MIRLVLGSVASKVVLINFLLATIGGSTWRLRPHRALSGPFAALRRVKWNDASAWQGSDGRLR